MTQPPYGQSQYGQPQYGQPAYGQPQYDQSQYGQQPPGYPPPGYPPAGGSPQGAGTNGFAVSALIFGLLGGILFSVIFGFIALSQIRTRGQKGKGMAITGLVLSAEWVVVFAAFIIYAVSTSANRDSTGAISKGGSVTASDLKTGDCVNGIEVGEVGSINAVPCARLHEGEVFAVFTIPGSDFPGESTVSSKAEAGCSSRLAGYSKSANDDETLDILYLQPTAASWKLGDHEVTCVVQDPTKKRTGSVKDG